MSPEYFVADLTALYENASTGEMGRFLEELLQVAREIQVKWEETHDWEVRKQLAFVEINNVVDRLTRSRTISPEKLGKLRQWQDRLDDSHDSPSHTTGFKTIGTTRWGSVRNIGSQ